MHGKGAASSGILRKGRIYRIEKRPLYVLALMEFFYNRFWGSEYSIIQLHCMAGKGGMHSYCSM